MTLVGRRLLPRCRSGADAAAVRAFTGQRRARHRGHRQSGALLRAAALARHRGDGARVSRSPSLRRARSALPGARGDPDDGEGCGKMRRIRRRALLVPAGARAHRSGAGRTCRGGPPWIPSCLKSWSVRSPRDRSSTIKQKQELVSQSARLAYPVRDGIPVMLEEEARRLDAGRVRVRLSAPPRASRPTPSRSRAAPARQQNPCRSPSSFRRAMRRRVCPASRSRTSRASRWSCGSPSARSARGAAARRGRDR